MTGAPEPEANPGSAPALRDAPSVLKDDASWDSELEVRTKRRKHRCISAHSPHIPTIQGPIHLFKGRPPPGQFKFWFLGCKKDEKDVRPVKFSGVRGRGARALNPLDPPPRPSAFCCSEIHRPPGTYCFQHGTLKSLMSPQKSL